MNTDDLERPDTVTQLHQAMKSLAMGKTDSQRQRVYQMLMISDLQIALQPGVSPDTARQDPSKWFISEYLQSMPVFVAFTCDEARALFSEAQPTALTIKGFELFPPLVSVNPGSLLLNPGFRFGGELYLNELKMLAKAAPKYRGMKF